VGTVPGPAHSITIDLGGVWSNVSTLEYLPKQWNRNNNTDGDITSYTISTSTDGTNFTQVATGTRAADRAPKVVEWAARNVGFVRIQADAATGGYANMGGVHIGGRTAKPVLKVADVFNFGKANGTNIQQWPWLNNTAQKWTFASTGDGSYEIKNVNGGKLMEVAGLSRADGGNVAIYADNNVPQQHWAVTPTGDGYYYLINRFSGLSLNVDAGSTADGANIDQLTYTRAPEQQWQIIAL